MSYLVISVHGLVGYFPPNDMISDQWDGMYALLYNGFHPYQLLSFITLLFLKLLGSHRKQTSASKNESHLVHVAYVEFAFHHVLIFLASDVLIMSPLVDLLILLTAPLV